ncbi:hypothetical protein C8R44DRAFT_891540 [Mycena epipterygia]|nr:hypothetical protein C8R44DRAFT_891540 [Mycena epipterygia]
MKLALAECEAATRSWGGQRAVDQLHEFMKLKEDGPWRARSAAVRSRLTFSSLPSPWHADGLRLTLLQRRSGGTFLQQVLRRLLERGTPIWSFHISRRRPNTILNSKLHAFDERLVNLAAEHLRVFVYCGTVDDPAVLREGMLVVLEESVAWIEHSPVGGPQEVVPITFPLVRPRQNLGGVVLT